MLALLSVFGVLTAGLAADALFSKRSDEDQQDRHPDEDEGHDQGNLLDELEGDPTIPTLGDLPDEVDQPIEVEGGDQINARGGDDRIDADDGNDMVWSGAGDDDVQGGDGNDTLSGDAGADTLLGGAGADSLAGCEDDDSLSGGTGNDTLVGGEGEDWLDSGEDADWLAGGVGDDTLLGGAGSDVLDGGAGHDVVSGVEEGRQEGDFLNGQDGNDTLFVGAGDYAIGGEGADEFVLQEWMSESSVAHILDYDPSQDQLVVVYDAGVHNDPVLTVEPNPGGSGQSILIDGAQVAVVNGAPVSVADIRLVPG